MLDGILWVMEGSTYLGVFLLTFLENVFPPLPSELILPLAGFLCAQGKMTAWGVLVSGSLGSLAGATFWYWVGRVLGGSRLERLAERHGRWLTMEPRDVRAAQGWFRRHGDPAVFAGRFTPGLRTLISVPAGIARMRMPRFLAWSLAGTVVWTSALLSAGYLLEGHYERLGGYLDPAADAVLGLMLAWYLVRVATYRARPRPGEQAR